MREFFGSAIGIVGFVLSILGTAFSVVGAVFTIALDPAAMGGVFLSAGIAFLAVGLSLGAMRVRAIRRRLLLLQTGAEAAGRIVALEQNRNVRVNRRHPWVVEYEYQAMGKTLRGTDSTFDLPAAYSVGASVPVRYDRSDASRSALARPS